MTLPGKVSRDEHDKIVLMIMDQMIACEWRTGHSHRLLAERYDVATSTVERWAAEAARYLRVCSGTEETVRARIVAGIERAIELALKAEHQLWAGGEIRSVAKPDIKSLLSGLELLGRAHGVFGATSKRVSDVNEEVPLQEVVEFMRMSGYVVTPPEKGDNEPTNFS